MQRTWPRSRVVGPAAATAAAAATFAVGEITHWRAARRLPAAAPLPAGTTGLIVLGFPSRRGGTPGAVQRWRVAIAQRTWQRLGGRDLIVFSGGATRGRPISEAKAMVDLALDQRWLDPDGIVDPTVVVLEEESTSTRENLACSLPLVERCDQIVIVSDALHASRAFAHATRQRPDLADRFAAADAYRFGEAWWIKPFSVLYSALYWARSRVRPADDDVDDRDDDGEATPPSDRTPPPNSTTFMHRPST